MLVAVYGSLRKGLQNHNRHLGKCKYLGQFNTEPLYSMYDLGRFPGVKKEGGTSVIMEVYELNDKKELNGLDYLEGYDSSKKYGNFYNRETIDTPYGEAYTYFYMHPVKDSDLIINGDWTEHMETQNLFIK